jgi:hypothetical protein
LAKPARRSFTPGFAYPPTTQFLTGTGRLVIKINGWTCNDLKCNFGGESINPPDLL